MLAEHRRERLNEESDEQGRTRLTSASCQALINAGEERRAWYPLFARPIFQDFFFSVYLCRR